jgi:hypothetical protein
MERGVLEGSLEVAVDYPAGLAAARAMEFLISRQKSDGSWGTGIGETAFMLYALLRGGLNPNDLAVQRGYEYLLRVEPARLRAEPTGCFSLSSAILALEARYGPPAARLTGKESPEKLARTFFQRQAPKDVVDRMEHLVAALQATWDDLYGKYKKTRKARLDDIFAACLALKAADRLGFKVRRSVWARALDYLLREQQVRGPRVKAFYVPAADAKILEKIAVDDFLGITRRPTRRKQWARGWGLKPGGVVVRSGTAAAVASLVLCKSELWSLAEYREKWGDPVDQALRDGMAWLADSFSLKEAGPGGSGWLGQNFGPVEAVGTLAAQERLGEHAWYSEGVARLLEVQGSLGEWNLGGGGVELDTAMAILFLQRGTYPVIRGAGTAVLTTWGRVSVRRLKGGTHEVVFRFRPPAKARKVFLAGTFTEWEKQKISMRYRDGYWTVSVKLGEGRHQYKYVIDGQVWQHDPSNPLSTDDGFGGRNSVLRLGR